MHEQQTAAVAPGCRGGELFRGASEQYRQRIVTLKRGAGFSFPAGSLPPLRATANVAEIAREEYGMALTCCDDLPSNSNQVHMSSGTQVVSRALVDLTGTRCGDDLEPSPLAAVASDLRTRLTQGCTSACLPCIEASTFSTGYGGTTCSGF